MTVGRNAKQLVAVLLLCASYLSIWDKLSDELYETSGHITNILLKKKTESISQQELDTNTFYENLGKTRYDFLDLISTIQKRVINQFHRQILLSYHHSLELNVKNLSHFYIDIPPPSIL